MYAVPDIEDFVAMELCLRKEGSPRAVSADEKTSTGAPGKLFCVSCNEKGEVVLKEDQKNNTTYK